MIYPSLLRISVYLHLKNYLSCVNMSPGACVFTIQKSQNLFVVIIHFGLPDAIVSSCFCLAYIYYRLPYIDIPTYLVSTLYSYVGTYC